MAYTAQPVIFFTLLIVIEVLFTPTFGTVVPKNLTVLNIKPSSDFIGQTFNNSPVVIHTQQQNYEQPTLREYEECHAKLELCKETCKTEDDRKACEAQCPICPILIDNKVLVQGVNDTLYRPELSISPSSPNTTNIIRLTNEIHNILDNHLGKWTHNNVNNIHVHQNISRVGGKYGLGFNNSHPCCILVHGSKSCENQRLSNAKLCRHKRQRICSEKCTARLIYARRVKTCADEEVDVEGENCQEIIKYVPYHSIKRSTQHYVHRSAKCHFQPNWPFVNCRNKYEVHWRRNMCRQCFYLPYGHILRHGLPHQCITCFNHHYSHHSTYSTGNINPLFWSNSPPWQTWWSGYDDDGYDEQEVNEDLSSLDVQGWRVDKSRCMLEDGTLSDDCIELIWEDDKDHKSPITDTPLNQEEDEDDDDDGDDGNTDDFDVHDESVNRKRRHIFKRSKYSHRFRGK